MYSTGKPNTGLTVSYAFVIVKLCTHDAKGITDKGFELATKIESVISWQEPSEANGTRIGLFGEFIR